MTRFSLFLAVAVFVAGCGASPEHAGYGRPPHGILTHRSASPGDTNRYAPPIGTTEGAGTTRNLTPWFSFETIRRVVSLHLTIKTTAAGRNAINGYTGGTDTILVPEGWSVHVTVHNLTAHPVRLVYHPASAGKTVQSPLAKPGALVNVAFTAGRTGPGEFRIIGLAPAPRMGFQVEPSGQLPRFETASPTPSA